MSSFWSRVAVVAAGLPLVLAVAWLGGWFLFALAAVAALLALHEFYRVARRFRPLVLAGYGGSLAALVGAELGGLPWMLGGFSGTLVLAFLLAAVARTRRSTTAAVATTVLGAAWIGLGLGFLLLVRAIEDGRDPLLSVLVIVFATDTFAYLGGRILGRHRMTPRMSPGKTWEGFVVGTIAGLVTAFFALYETEYAAGWRSLALGGVVVLSATVGDLFESLVKRDLEVKDTGRLLGGHGGVLDRIDSLLFAGPAAYFVLLALGEA